MISYGLMGNFTIFTILRTQLIFAVYSFSPSKEDIQNLEDFLLPLLYLAYTLENDRVSNSADVIKLLKSATTNGNIRFYTVYLNGKYVPFNFYFKISKTRIPKINLMLIELVEAYRIRALRHRKLINDSLLDTPKIENLQEVGNVLAISYYTSLEFIDHSDFMVFLLTI
jgi:hypothetical protein